jgi:hypothetical protein
MDSKWTFRCIPWTVLHILLSNSTLCSVKLLKYKFCFFYLMCLCCWNPVRYTFSKLQRTPLGTLSTILHSLQSLSLLLYSIFYRISWRNGSLHFNLPVTCTIADHSGRAVWVIKCLRSLEHCDRGFESHLKHGCLFAFILCLCCLASGWSPVQGVLPTV